MATLRRWFDTQVHADEEAGRDPRIDWLRAIPFIGMHVACVAVLWVGVSPIAVIVAVALYAVAALRTWFLRQSDTERDWEAEARAGLERACRLA